MVVTRQTTVAELLAHDPGAADIILQHGVDVHVMCPHDVHEYPLEDCEWMCGIQDVDQLIEDLNDYINRQEQSA